MVDGLTSRIKSVFGHISETSTHHMQSGLSENISNVVVDEFVRAWMLSCGYGFLLIRVMYD